MGVGGMQILALQLQLIKVVVKGNVLGLEGIMNREYVFDEAFAEAFVALAA